MLKNQIHNLIHQVSEISDSLWRIEKYYLEETESCETCIDLWREFHQDYERQILKLNEEIKKHL